MQMYLDDYDVTVMSSDVANNEYGDDFNFDGCDAVIVREDVPYGGIEFGYNQRDVDDWDEAELDSYDDATVIIAIDRKHDDFSICYKYPNPANPSKICASEFDPKCPLSDDMRDKDHNIRKFIESCIECATDLMNEDLIENWNPYYN